MIDRNVAALLIANGRREVDDRAGVIVSIDGVGRSLDVLRTSHRTSIAAAAAALPNCIWAGDSGVIFACIIDGVAVRIFAGHRFWSVAFDRRGVGYGLARGTGCVDKLKHCTFAWFHYRAGAGYGRSADARET